MNRRSAVVRAARMFQRLPQGWLRSFEAPLVWRYASGAPNLVFLLALPRSGSTLTYQALVHALQPFYLSNLANLLYGAPWFGGQICQRHCSGHESDFRSNHGFVEGLCGPAEGLRFWSYWTAAGLDETAPVKVSPAHLDRRIAYFREVICALASAEKPFVGGYLGHVLVAERLRAWFPEAIFVRLHRDPLSNAASIVRSRTSGSGSWFSTFPKECTSVKGTGPHAETASQVYWLNRRLAWLEEDSRTVHVTYEGLGADPNAVLQHVIATCNSYGLALRTRNQLPASFSYRVAAPEDNADTRQLASELLRLEAEHGPLSQALPGSESG